MTTTDRVRQLTNRIIIPLGHWLKDKGVHPDLLTFVGFILVAVAAIPLAQGRFVIAGILLAAGMPIDALDGATARAYGSERLFGAFLDSTLDRYADAIIFGSLTFYYAQNADLGMVVAALVALHGSLTVSYTRARAEGLGLECKVGWLSRMERVVLLLITCAVSLIDLRLVNVGVILLAVGTQITALQRIIHVARISKPLNNLEKK